MAGQLPNELIVEILSILTAKSLLRCQLVCKSWLSLINSTKFKLMHLHNFNQLNPRYLICQYNNGKESYNVHLDDEALTIDGGTLVEFPSNHSLISENCRTSGLCCNGVLCLSIDDSDEESSFDEIILWNPCIRRKVTLTVPSFYPIDFEESFFILGFGYDKMSDDYKVVCLAYSNYVDKTRAEVYSLKTGIWREVMFPDDLCCFIIFPEWSKVFFNGSVHWIARHRRNMPSHNSSMTFDTSSEIFGQIVLPDDLVKVDADSMMISVLGEYLAVTYDNHPSMSSSSYKIWVMKEYKKPASWIMIYNMYYPDIDLGIPLQLRNKADGNMIIYDHNASDIDDVGYRYYVERYQESLVLLDVGDIVPNKKAMKALMMIEKQESGHGADVAARQG